MARGHGVGGEEEVPEAEAPQSHSRSAVGDSVLCPRGKGCEGISSSPLPPLEISPSLREFPEEDISKLLCFVFLLLLSLFESPSFCLCTISLLVHCLCSQWDK